MTDARRAAPLAGGVALLERAIGYTLGQLHGVTTDDLTLPTPCPQWDLRALLGHMHDSLAALREALRLRQVGPEPAPWYGPADSAVALVGRLRDQACGLVGELAEAGEELVWVGGFPIPASVVASAGAVDIALHGWDVGRACGRGRPIPEPLALDMLEVASLLVSGADRPSRFGPAVPVPPDASAGDRLLAFLGRDPR